MEKAQRLSRLPKFIVSSLAVAILCGPAWAEVDCSKPAGIFALMFAGAIANGSSQCVPRQRPSQRVCTGNGPCAVISFLPQMNCTGRSNLFAQADRSPNSACAAHVKMHLFWTYVNGALNPLPNLATQPNWSAPGNVKTVSAGFALHSGSANSYDTSALFELNPFSANKTVYYRWGKEIERSDAVNPWVFSSVLTFVTPNPAPSPSAPPAPPPPGPPVAILPNLLPALGAPTVLARAIVGPVATTQGPIFQVNDAFCSNLAANSAGSVAVPVLQWGVTGVNIQNANAQFQVQLIDTTASPPQVLDTLTLPSGFPPNTPLVFRQNYPGRPATINVVKNPTLPFGPSATQTFLGCFTQPGTAPTLERGAMMIKVDTGNQIGESNENDNELSF
jgi:hypothetical protein